jgi:transcriptional regulator with XRE-family HTH domain
MREILKSVDNKQSGKKLLYLRKARGLIQQEVADRLVIVYTTLTAIEKGERLISSDGFMDLSKPYNE